MVFVEMKDGSIQLVRVEIHTDRGHARIDDTDLDKSEVKRIVGNYFCCPAWVELTPDQEAKCKAWTGHQGGVYRVTGRRE